MVTFLMLVPVVALVWIAHRLGKLGGKRTNIAALLVGLLAGVCLAGTVLLDWLQAIPGPVVPYIAAGGLLVSAVIAGVDIAKDRKADMPAIVCAVAVPLLVILGGPTAIETITNSGGDGITQLTSTME